jgi:hypothetical protein
MVSVEGQGPSGQPEETQRPHLVEALLGQSVVLRPLLEAVGRGGLVAVGSKVPSHQKAEVRRALVGQLHEVVEHMGQAPHSMGEERKGLLLLQVVGAALLQAVQQNPDEERRGQWPVVAQTKEDELRTGFVVNQQNQGEDRIQDWGAGADERVAEAASPSLVEAGHQEAVVTILFHGQLEVGEYQL